MADPTRLEMCAGAYEVAQDGADAVVASGAARYTTAGRTAQETVVLDLGTLGDYRGPFQIRVRITDATTGQSAERSLGFEMVD